MRERRPRSRGILTPLQREILEAFRGLPDADRFYLTGGTALAEFYLGHRRSFDLDLFTAERGLVVPFSRVMEEDLRRAGPIVESARCLDTSAEFEIGKGDDAVRAQLALDSPFRFAPPVDTPLIPVNDYRDLWWWNKLLAFFGRAEPRDAVDFFFVIFGSWPSSRAKRIRDSTSTGSRGPWRRSRNIRTSFPAGRWRWSSWWIRWNSRPVSIGSRLR